MRQNPRGLHQLNNYKRGLVNSLTGAVRPLFLSYKQQAPKASGKDNDWGFKTVTG
jgi:hypothetical protein